MVREKDKMRLDYALYVMAIIFFLLTGTAFAIQQLEEVERNVWVITTAILGILFIGLGYTQRPKTAAIQTVTPPPPQILPTVAEVVEEKKEVVPEIVSPKVELTEVKGIGEKRKEQLKALGINSIEELAKASAEDLALKLKISPKITGKWIENAKKLVEKA